MISLLTTPLDSFNSDIHDPFWPALSAHPVHRIVTTRPATKHDLWSLMGSDLLHDGLGELPMLQDKHDKYVIQVATPGVKQEHLTVELVGRRQLVVSAGTRKTDGPDSDATAHTTSQDQRKTSDAQHEQAAERKGGGAEAALCLRKAVTLPEDADTEALSLRYADGMLTVEAPKRSTREPKEEEEEEEAAALAAEVKRRRARVESLREVEEERGGVLEAESKLREARAASRLRIAPEPRPRAIAQ